MQLVNATGPDLLTEDFGAYGRFHYAPGDWTTGDPAVLFDAASFDDGSRDIMPDDAKRPSFRFPGSDVKHMLVPGEGFYEGAGLGLQQPSEDRRAMVLNALTPLMRLDNLERFPRIAHVLALHENRGDPGLNAQGQDRTYWWHHKYRAGRWGGPNLTHNPDGSRHWYYGYTPLSTDGWNWGYEQVMWCVLAYLRNPTPETWTSTLGITFGLCCFFQHRAGSRNGMFRNEGGWVFAGEAKQPEWSKQTCLLGLIAMWMLTGHPFFGWTVRRHFEAAKHTPLTWDGYGERTAGWALVSLALADHLDGDPIYKQRATALIADMKAKQTPDGLWSNAPGDASGWMCGKVGYGAHYFAPGATWIRRIYDGLANLVDRNRYGGYPAVPYRYDPIDWNGAHPNTHPALITLGMRPYLPDLETEILTAVDRHIGSDWYPKPGATGTVVPDNPQPIDQIGFALGEDGSGMGLKGWDLLLLGAAL